MRFSKVVLSALKTSPPRRRRGKTILLLARRSRVSEAHPSKAEPR